MLEREWRSGVDIIEVDIIGVRPLLCLPKRSIDYGCKRSIKSVFWI